MYPKINISTCTDCRLCVKDCISEAIEPESKTVSGDACNLCGHCLAVCPHEAVTIQGFETTRPQYSKTETRDYFNDLVQSRRSVRHYNEEPVEQSVIDAVLSTASYAPTGTNSRMTSTTVLSGRDEIKALTDIVMKHFRFLTALILNPFTAVFLNLFLGKKRTRRLFGYKNFINRYWTGRDVLAHGAPLLMIFHTSRYSSTPYQDGVIRATTALYAAESHGLGTCFNGFLVIGINTCSKARKLLGIPRNHRVYETFTAGYPAIQYQRNIKRKDQR